MTYSRPTTVAFALAMICTCGQAGAQAPRYEAARQIVAEKLGADFTQRQVAALNVVAHSTAASVLCDSLDPNELAVRSQLQRVLAESAPTVRGQAAREALRDRMLVGFGALLGLMLQDAAPNNPRFCAAAEADMRRQGAASLLVPHRPAR